MGGHHPALLIDRRIIRMCCAGAELLSRLDLSRRRTLSGLRSADQVAGDSNYQSLVTTTTATTGTAHDGGVAGSSWQAVGVAGSGGTGFFR